ncbi:MAG TPA: hypothetical protein VFO35_05385 [Steroidobacteraceae bacterium]|nr:hypothetical protein [Steroidobacteraceae bacterium]
MTIAPCNARLTRMLIGAGALLLIANAHAQVTALRASQRLPMPPISAPQPTQEARFGEYVATDGQTLLVTVSEGPAAYTYVKKMPGKKWAFEGALAPVEGTTALSGAVRGNIAAVGGVVGEENAVFIFARTQGQWLQTQTITGFDFSVQFNMIALGADYLAIGDFGFNDFRGGVHIYNQTGAGTYELSAVLTPGDPNAPQGWLLGFLPIASGDTLTVAAPGGEKVHVFVRTGGVWTEEAQLNLLSNPSYAFSGDRILLPEGQVVGQSSRVQEFLRSGGVWSPGGELINPRDPEFGLGTPVSIDGVRAVAGEASQDVPTEDALVFELGSAGWAPTARLRDAILLECRGLTDVTLAIAGRSVVASCPNGRNGHPAFEGYVTVYDLPQ